MVFLLGKFMGKVFFGQLRAAEMEVSRNGGDLGEKREILGFRMHFLFLEGLNSPGLGARYKLKAFLCF